ncbi:hypothetical protein PVAP13_3KG129500 [Panicum virgatum]|uniref:Uncharacterized protein n=1 Tax=Panicum virgatum TaxID=38727 RepID=A0A8T0UQP0_PANVG|nr:hypothetical protein PVAP13_3KG129500 [Panicum virgatum]
MVNDDPLDDENPRSHTANSIHDNKREQMLSRFPSHDQCMKTTVFDFVVQTDKTSSESSRRPRFQGQASVVAPA